MQKDKSKNTNTTAKCKQKEIHRQSGARERKHLSTSLYCCKLNTQL